MRFNLLRHLIYFLCNQMYCKMQSRQKYFFEIKNPALLTPGKLSSYEQRETITCLGAIINKKLWMR